MKTKKEVKPLDTLRAEYEAELRAMINQRLGNLESIVDNVIEKAAFEIVANAIGVKRDRWDDVWEVDHCNGRRSAVAEELGKRAMEQVRETIPTFVGQFTKKRGMKIALQREFDEQYERRLMNAVREAAVEMANYDAEEAIAAFRQIAKP